MPTEMLTDTTPPRPMPPVTLPPPADETRVPDTMKGTLLVELQLPARVVNITFQVPSYIPAWVNRLTSAPQELATRAAKTAADKLHRNPREVLKRADGPADRAEKIIFI